MDRLSLGARYRATYSFVTHHLPSNTVYTVIILMEPVKAPIVQDVKHTQIAAGNPYPQTQQVDGGIGSILDYIAKPCSEIIGNHWLSSAMIYRVK